MTSLLLLLFIFIPASHELKLLFANRRDISLLESYPSSATPPSRNHGPPTTIKTIIPNLTDVTSLDWEGSTICWTDIEEGVIYCEQDGVKSSVVTTNLPAPEDMAIDWLTRKIYWTDSENNRIEVVGMDKPYHRAVVVHEDLDQPRAVVVCVELGLLFWSDWGESPRIEKSTMSGAGRAQIVNTDLFWPNGLALDTGKRVLYWVDAKLHTIGFVEFDGNRRGKIGRETTGHPFALVFSNSSFYWSDWHTNSLHMLPYTTPMRRPIQLSPHNSLTPMDLVDYSPRPQINSPCARAPCSHLCLLEPASKFTCICPTGIGKLNSTHCRENIEQFLLVARGTEMRIISLDTGEYTDLVLDLKGLRHVLAVEWIEVGPDEHNNGPEGGGWVYWTDDEKRVIERATLKGTRQSPIIQTQIIHPDGLAIDPLAKNLYWTDAGTDRIEVSRLDGSFRRVIISKHLQEPRAIAVDPIAGYLFWSDWGRRPKIERSFLDGSGRIAIVTDEISWPNGIALDGGNLYWCDGKTDKIEVVPYSGSPRRVLISSNLPHTFGFTILNDDLYWTDWQRRVIEKSNINGLNRVIIKDPFPDPMGLRAVKRGQWTGISNGCSNSNGGCSELCFWVQSRVKCGCRTGFELDYDNVTCIDPPAFLIYSGTTDLHRVSLIKRESEELLPLGKVKAPVAVETMGGGWVYWSDSNSKVKALLRGRVDGSGAGGGVEKIIETGLFHPEGLAIDPQSGNIYFTDMGSGKVEVCTLEGKYRRTVVWDIEGPRAIVVDQIERHLYFSTWSTSTPPGILRTNLDGSEISAFLENSRSNGLTIDSGFLYYTNIDSEAVCRKSLTGTGVEVLFKGLSPFSIAVHDNLIYFSSLTSGTIYSISKTQPDTPKPILTNSGNVLDMKVFKNTTVEANCSCPGLCFLMRMKTVCACGNHNILKNGTCAGPEEFLLVGGPSGILRVLNTPSPDDVILNVKGVKGVDWGRKNIIYSGPGGTMKGIDIPLNDVSTFAIDRAAGLIFYGVKGGGINVTSLSEDGISGTVVPSNSSGNYPQYISLHPATSTVFYTADTGLHSIRYDGQKGQKLFDGDISGISVSENNLFFTQGQTMWKCGLDGSSKAVVIKLEDETTDLAVWERIIFYTNSSGLYKFNTGSKMTTQVLQTQPTALRFVNLTIQEPTACTNTQCSFCVAGICSCPAPLILSSDGRHCLMKLACGAGEFECRGGAVGCINSINRCDGVAQCFDSSDEDDCPTETPVCWDCETKSNSAPWGIIITIVAIIAGIVICVFIYRRRRRVKTSIPAGVTTEPLFHAPPSHTSSSPYCELLAPHPSPATDCCREYYVVNPPPTPCSTDVCSDVVYSPPPPSPGGSGSGSGVVGSSGRSGRGGFGYYVPPPPSPS